MFPKIKARKNKFYGATVNKFINYAYILLLFLHHNSSTKILGRLALIIFQLSVKSEL